MPLLVVEGVEYPEDRDRSSACFFPFMYDCREPTACTNPRPLISGKISAKSDIFGRDPDTKMTVLADKAGRTPQFGLETMRVGGGQGMAMVLERLS